MKWHTKNRLLAFLLVFVFAFGLAACNDNTAEEATTPAGAVTTTAEGAADAATDTVGDAVDATADTVGDAANATTDAVGDATDATTDTVSDSLDGATDTAGDAADATTDATVDAVQETAETTDEAVESVNEATTDTISDAAETTEETAEITTEPIGDAADATTDTATDAAAAVGAELDGVRSQIVSDMEGLDLTDENETNVLTVRNTLTTARENLATAYAGADEAGQAEWAELQPQFEEAEATLQDNAAEGLQQVQALLERLQQTVSQ